MDIMNVTLPAPAPAVETLDSVITAIVWAGILGPMHGYVWAPGVLEQYHAETNILEYVRESNLAHDQRLGR